MDTDGTVALAVGENVITVEVTAEDGNTTQTYTVTVTRMVSNSDPTFNAGLSTMISVKENTASGTNIGEPYTATDSDSSDTLTYTLGGTDGTSFGIDSSTGQLETGTALNFEVKASYSVTVNVRDSKDSAGDADTATDDTIDVTITVTNEDEAGTASFTGMLSGGLLLTASVSDPDGSISNRSYQWQRSSSQTSGFSDITTNGTSVTYTTVAADVGQYLRVIVSYTDGYSSGRSATSAARGTVAGSNSPPAFNDGPSTTRTVPENSGGGVAVGTAVTASDSDNSDTLTYSLSGTDVDDFDIDSSNGQITTRSTGTYNFEAAKNTYEVTVSVHDGKDAAGGTDTSTIDDTIDVAISLTNVNEAPTLGTVSLNESVAENTPASQIIATYTASDVDASDDAYLVAGKR